MKSHSGSVLQTVFTTGFLVVSMLSGPSVFAQEPPAPNAPPPQDATQAQPADQQLSPEELDNLVAPIALYPDPLLSQVLTASTYPLEIVEAQQWLQRNTTLQGEQLMNAARQQDWDPSVQALVAFPDVISRLTQDIRWTTDLGNAFLSQESDVMNEVQRMRSRAQANGKLTSSAQQNVTTETKSGQTVIEIQPASPQVIYVPTYDPAYVWGPPVLGVYPPLFYPGFGFGFGGGINVGFFFGGWGGWGGWGWSPGWFGHGVFVNNFFFNRYGFHGHFGHGFSPWVHNPGHRLGVPYSNHQLAAHFHGPSSGARFGGWRTGSQIHSRGQHFGNSFHGGNGFHGDGGFHGGGSGFHGGSGGFHGGGGGFHGGGGGFHGGGGGFHGGGGGFHGGGGGFHGGGGGFHGGGGGFHGGGGGFHGGGGGFHGGGGGFHGGGVGGGHHGR